MPNILPEIRSCCWCQYTARWHASFQHGSHVIGNPSTALVAWSMLGPEPTPLLHTCLISQVSATTAAASARSSCLPTPSAMPSCAGHGEACPSQLRMTTHRNALNSSCPPHPRLSRMLFCNSRTGARRRPFLLTEATGSQRAPSPTVGLSASSRSPGLTNLLWKEQPDHRSPVACRRRGDTALRRPTHSPAL